MYLSYVFKRLIALLPTLFLMSLFIFSLLYVAGGSPAATILGMEATGEEIRALNEKLGYTRPFHIQYFDWLKGAVRGDLGQSLFLKKPVTEALMKNLPTSLEMALLAEFISLIIAIPLGIRAAEKPGSPADRVLTAYSALFMALPSFILSLILIVVFSLVLKLLPSSGFRPWSDGALVHLRYLIMPALALGLSQAGLIGRMTRESVAEIRKGFLVKSLKSRGLDRKRVRYNHILKNALLPIITLIGSSFATLLAGSVITETVFQIPGLGLLMMNAIQRRDLPLVQGVILLITVIYLVVNFITDLIYGLVDPRIRLAGEGR